MCLEPWGKQLEQVLSHYCCASIGPALGQLGPEDGAGSKDRLTRGMSRSAAMQRKRSTGRADAPDARHAIATPNKPRLRPVHKPTDCHQRRTFRTRAVASNRCTPPGSPANPSHSPDAQSRHGPEASSLPGHRIARFACRYTHRPHLAPSPKFLRYSAPEVTKRGEPRLSRGQQGAKGLAVGLQKKLQKGRENRAAAAKPTCAVSTGATKGHLRGREPQLCTYILQEQVSIYLH